MLSFILAVFTGLLAAVVNAATPADWRSRSIYFLLTDRFGRTDNSITAPCDTNARVRSFLTVLVETTGQLTCE